MENKFRRARKDKPDWEIGCPVVPAFLLALLIGGEVVPPENPNVVGDVDGFDDDSLRSIVEEGRQQIAAQTDRYRHATDRGQLLVTVDIALLGFLAALLHRALDVHGDRKWWAFGIWCVATLLAVIGTGAAAATMTVVARFSSVDTTTMTGWQPPVLKELALDYARAVRSGEMTVALRVTVFRKAARISILAGLLAAFAFGLSL